MNNRENGSWLGVMTAANVVMPDRGPAPAVAELAGVHHADEQQEHEEQRELEREAERREHQHHERQVLVGVDERPQRVAADARAGTRAPW